MPKSIFQINMLRRVILICFALGWASVIAFGQDRSLGAPPFGDKHVGGDVPVDERLAARNRDGPPAEDRVLRKGELAPSKDDRAAFATFLRIRDTGLIRLLSSERITYQKGPPFIPGTYYSFANVTHSLDYGSDIEFEPGQLSVGFLGHGYGMLANLGNVPLEQIDLSDPRTGFIKAYRPAVTFFEARAETLRFRDGFVIDGTRYQDRLTAEVNSTYLLRSINYDKAVFGSIHRRSAARNAHRTDVLVAFRVVRKDTDDSLIIAWKLLKKYPAPKLD